MNDQGLLERLTGSGIHVTSLAALADCSRQNLIKGARNGTSFTLERLIVIYDHLRKNNSANLQALCTLSRLIEARRPALGDGDRHLAELSPEPWRRARMLLPDKEWLTPMLTALGHDRRPYAFQREIVILPPHADPTRIRGACIRHFNLRYRLKLLRADAPARRPWRKPTSEGPPKATANPATASANRSSSRPSGASASNWSWSPWSTATNGAWSFAPSRPFNRTRPCASSTKPARFGWKPAPTTSPGRAAETSPPNPPDSAAWA